MCSWMMAINQKEYVQFEAAAIDCSAQVTRGMMIYWLWETMKILLIYLSCPGTCRDEEDR